MRILGIDPGSVGFGWSLVEVKGSKLRIIKCGTLTQTLTQLKDSSWQDELHLYALQMEKLLNKAKPNAIVMERYFARHRGLESEKINMMIGVLTRIIYEQHPKVRITLLMAATWKNALKRRGFDLESLYKECKPVPKHSIDASFQATYLVRDKAQWKSITRVLISNIRNSYVEFQ